MGIAANITGDSVVIMCTDGPGVCYSGTVVADMHVGNAHRRTRVYAQTGTVVGCYTAFEVQFRGAHRPFRKETGQCVPGSDAVSHRHPAAVGSRYSGQNIPSQPHIIKRSVYSG